MDRSRQKPLLTFKPLLPAGMRVTPKNLDCHGISSSDVAGKIRLRSQTAFFDPLAPDV
jgi:hypothetical protein